MMISDRAKEDNKIEIHGSRKEDFDNVKSRREVPVAGLKQINVLNIAAGIVGRIIFVLLSEYNDGLHDAMTDIDMTVYSQGAKAFLRYGNTDSVPEFKYSPLVAILAIPFAYSTLVFKLGMAMFDIINAILYSKITSRLYGPNRAGIALTMYTYNPLIVAIACRGSFEAPCSFFIALGALFYLDKRYLFSGMCFGIAAQLRVYPFIFWPTLVLATRSYSFSTGFILGVSPIIFGLKQAFMFHVGRVDVWHNISIWWTSLLTLSQNRLDVDIHGIDINALLAIIPIIFQLGISLLPALKIFKDKNPRTVLKTLYVQALCFVTFSKVQTAQYWDWWLLWSCVFSSGHPFRWLLLNTFFSFVGIAWNNPSYAIEGLKINSFATIARLNKLIYFLQLAILLCM